MHLHDRLITIVLLFLFHGGYFMYESYINKIEDVGKLRNLKPKTITLYQKNVSRFLNYIKKNPEELTCEDARNYLLHLQGKGDKASTLNNNNGSLVEDLPEFFFPTSGLVNISQLPVQDLFSKSL